MLIENIIELKVWLRVIIKISQKVRIKVRLIFKKAKNKLKKLFLLIKTFWAILMTLSKNEKYWQKVYWEQDFQTILIIKSILKYN